MGAVAAIAALVSLGWFAFDSLKIRERANQVAMRSCQRYDVQFLDGTVAFASLRPVMSSSGLRLRRVFVFDYSEDGENRKEGFLVFVGHHVTNLGFQQREIN